MKTIDTYLNTLYKNDHSKEMKELKEEMREHLIESVNDLKNDGYSEEEAIQNAIERFDGGADFIKELHATIKNSKNENTKIMRRIINIFRDIAIITLSICLLSSIISIHTQNKRMNVSNDIYKAVNEMAATGNTADPNAYKEKFDKLLSTKEFKNLKFLEIYDNTKNIVDYKDRNLQYKYIGESFNSKDLWGSGMLTNAKAHDGYKLDYYFGLAYDFNYILTNIATPCMLIGVISLTVYLGLAISFKIDKIRSKKLSY